jgi:NHL repeat
MNAWRYLYAGTLALALIIGAGLWNPLQQTDAQTGAKIPRFFVDPSWPKPLPNRWVTGEVAGTCIDSKDHIFTVNRRNLLDLQKTLGLIPAPPVIEFDGEGNVVNAWGDPAIMPNGIHGCFVDHEDSVWIGGNGDGIVQKYSHDGKALLLQIGTRGVCDSPTGACGVPSSNSSRDRLNQPADVAVDPAGGDIYIADGYGNHRVVVFDRTGKYLRQWGSPGTDPGQFAPGGGGHPHCVVLGRDGLLYVCDRANDRIQVFDKMGKVQGIIPVKPGTGTPGRGAVGSANDLDFSIDDKIMYVNDVGNSTLWFLDRVAGNKIIGGFGRPGHMAGEFTLFHSVVRDSRGNLYTGETVGGRRSQKFIPRGTVPDDKLEAFLGSPHYVPHP